MCDCERPEFYDETQPRSRRPRRCYDCDRLIETGERYLRASGKWSGSFETFATCLDCLRIRAWLERRIDCCVPFGELAEILADEDLTWAEALKLANAQATVEPPAQIAGDDSLVIM